MIKPSPLTKSAFEPFGEVIEMDGEADFSFNDNRAKRWHDLLTMDVDENGRIGVSLGASTPISLPYDLTFVERHPLASQAFIPLNDRPFLVIVAQDQNGTPNTPIAFITNGHQGVNYKRGTWHGVLVPIDLPQDFIIIDRVEGDGNNLEIFNYLKAHQIANG